MIFKDQRYVTVFTDWDFLHCKADCVVWVCFLCKTNPTRMALLLLKAVIGPPLFWPVTVQGVRFSKCSMYGFLSLEVFSSTAQSYHR